MEDELCIGLSMCNKQEYNNLIFKIQKESLINNIAYELIKNTDDRLDEAEIDKEDTIKKILNSLPVGIIYKLTILYGKHICNFNCPSCYTKNIKTEQLRIEHYKEIIQKSKKLGSKYTYWPGIGELTFDLSFWELMEFQNKLSYPAVVFTNGSVFYNNSLSQAYLKLNCEQVLEKVKRNRGLYLYVKLWSTNRDLAYRMTGTSDSNYKYELYKGLDLPYAFILLHRLFGKRIGVQCMVTKENYDDYVNNILPFCLREKVSLFAEPIIQDKSNRNVNYSKLELSTEQYERIKKTFASSHLACRRRQFGELIINGNSLTPGIAIKPRSNDKLIRANQELIDIREIYFNSYFRQNRKLAEKIEQCLCRYINSK